GKVRWQLPLELGEIVRDRRHVEVSEDRFLWLEAEAGQCQTRCSAAHSITSSAISRISRVIVRPSGLAALRLMTNSNLVGCSTGKSAGLAPLRILSTYTAVCRARSGRFAP